MSATTNYGLNIYTDAEMENLGTVRTWRSKMDGTGSDSNMVKIDAALKSIADSVKNPVTNVNALPTANQAEFDKHLLYLYNDSLYYIQYANNTYSYVEVGVDFITTNEINALFTTQGGGE